MRNIPRERVRALLTLQRQALQFASDEQRTRDVLVKGMVDLVGAEIGLFVEDPHFFSGSAGELRALSAYNLEPAWTATEMVLEDRSASPILARMLEGPRSGVSSVRGRAAVPRREWYRSEYFDRGIRPSGCDEVMGAMLPLGGSSVLGVNVVRARQDRAFSEEDASVLELFLESCGSALRRRLSAAERFGLTPRQAQTLEQLLLGASNKELAEVLQCSPRTAEAHVAAVLRKCGVEGRAQLPARVESATRVARSGP